MAFRARVIATQVEWHHLKPGDLFSEMGPAFWNRAMGGGLTGWCCIRSNDDEVESDSASVYRLTVVLESEEGTARNAHVMHHGLDPSAPPGMSLSDWLRKK